jgi:alpha-tubulin suppressor-like RCC1 family protein
LALSEEGQIFSWGKNDRKLKISLYYPPLTIRCVDGQLGLGGGITMDVYSLENYPRALEGVEGVEFAQIAAGHVHAAALTKDGQLYMWGMKAYLDPHCMTALKEHTLVSVACGTNYTAVLTDKGQLFTFGKGRSSALGHGDRKTKLQPTLVEALEGHIVRDITCGGHHMGALVETGAADSDFSMRE